MMPAICSSASRRQSRFRLHAAEAAVYCGDFDQLARVLDRPASEDTVGLSMIELRAALACNELQLAGGIAMKSLAGLGIALGSTPTLPVRTTPVPDKTPDPHISEAYVVMGKLLHLHILGDDRELTAVAATLVRLGQMHGGGPDLALAFAALAYAAARRHKHSAAALSLIHI